MATSDNATPSSAGPAGGCLVVGADGFLGRHLADALERRGERVHRIGRADGDLVEGPTVERLFAAAPKVARIFHCVTRQRTGEVQYGIQGELLAINARIHLNVLEAWRHHQPQAKLVSPGSSCVYPELDRPIPETAFQSGPMHPSVRGYGLAKQVLIVGSEAYAAQYGLRYLHAVLATVYGPGDHTAPDRSHFMTAMIDRAVAEMRAGETEFTVWGSPDTVRDLLYVDDQIDAVLAADAAFENEIVNCGSGNPVTIGAAAEAIRTALGWNVPIVYPSGTFQGASFKSIDAKRFLGATGWRPTVDLVEGVRRVLAADYRIGAARKVTT
jgi:GDP-L-fucose synthase